MMTRFDMASQSFVVMLLSLKHTKLISESEYTTLYNAWFEELKPMEQAHPREENTLDCDELEKKGRHI